MPTSQGLSARPSGTQSVCRALDLLMTLGKTNGSMSVTDLAESVNVHISTASRLLGALQAYDFVVQDHRTQQFQLGPRCFQLGQVFVSQVEVAVVAEPFMSSLTTQTKLQTHLGVLSENRLVRVKHVEPEGHVLRLSAGERFSLGELHCEALGKVLLAFQPNEVVHRLLDSMTFNRYTSTTITSATQMTEEIERIRKRGFAIDNGERLESIRCVAVPIWNHRDGIAAGLSASGSEKEITKRRIAELARILHDTANAISHRLGASTLKTNIRASHK